MSATLEEGTTQRRLVHLVIFAGISALSLLAAAIDLWAGVGFFFLALFVFAVFRFRSSAHLNWVVLGYVFLLLWVGATNFYRFWLSPNPPDRPVNIFRAMLTNNTARVDWEVVFTAAGFGFLIASAFFLLLLLLAAAVAAAGTYREEGVTFGEQFSHLLTSLLGRRRFLVEIDGGEIKGEELDKHFLEKLGGPGRLIIYPGQLVVLRKHGQVTRVVGAGKTNLRYQEKIKAIVPIAGKANVQEIEHVQTRDGIPLTVKVAHGARLETVGETDERLREVWMQLERDERTLRTLKRRVKQLTPVQDVKSLEEVLISMEATSSSNQNDIDLLKEYLTANDKVHQDRALIKQLRQVVQSEKIGEGAGAHYFGIASKAPADPFEATKGLVESNLRDAFMAHDFDDLFKVEGEGEEVQSQIDSRKIGEIETYIRDKVRATRQGEGFIINFVDVASVQFPEMVQEKLNEELAMQVESRAKVSAARLDEEAATYEAKAMVIRARARAQQMMLEGRGEGEARAAIFREFLRELKRENTLQGDQWADAVIKHFLPQVPSGPRDKNGSSDG